MKAIRLLGRHLRSEEGSGTDLSVLGTTQKRRYTIRWEDGVVATVTKNAISDAAFSQLQDSNCKRKRRNEACSQSNISEETSSQESYNSSESADSDWSSSDEENSMTVENR